MNSIEISVSALQRSGHHAIINWIIANQKTNYCFLNNCYPHSNPFITASKTDSSLQHVQIEEELLGNFSDKDLLIYNYEDKSLPDIFYPEFKGDMGKWLGKSEQAFNVLILRDPFNNFASKYHWAKNGKKWQPSLDSIRQLPVLWKTYAKEFLNQTNFITQNKITISYNEWFKSDNYRAKLASDLLLVSSDKSVTEVAKWGPNTWGDSVDNLTYDGKANEMKVLERWKLYADDPFFISLFDDNELIELSEKIFGHIPNTEFIVSKAVKHNLH
jgi:hypothetical protein